MLKEREREREKKKKTTKHKACRANGIRETTNNEIKRAIRNDRLCTDKPSRQAFRPTESKQT